MEISEETEIQCKELFGGVVKLCENYCTKVPFYTLCGMVGQMVGASQVPDVALKHAIIIIRKSAELYIDGDKD